MRGAICRGAMGKILFSFISMIVCSISFAGPVFYKGITITVPDSWSINNSVLHDGSGAKIGELIPKNAWQYSTGEQFFSAYEQGFFDDSEDTKFLQKDLDGEIYWVCRSGWAWDGKGGGGIWYTRTFWVNGTILNLYSHKSCEENIAEALKIAGSLKEA